MTSEHIEAIYPGIIRRNEAPGDIILNTSPAASSNRFLDRSGMGAPTNRPDKLISGIGEDSVKSNIDRSIKSALSNAPGAIQTSEDRRADDELGMVGEIIPRQQLNVSNYRQPPGSYHSDALDVVNSMSASSVVKIAALAAVGFYIYKSVKDGGVQTVEGGPKRSIFKWIDAAGGLIIAIYLFNLARSTMFM